MLWSTTISGGRIIDETDISLTAGPATDNEDGDGGGRDSGLFVVSVCRSNRFVGEILLNITSDTTTRGQ